VTTLHIIDAFKQSEAVEFKSNIVILLDF